MEKMIYLLWKPDNGAENWEQQLATNAIPAMQAAGTRQLRLNLADGDVAAGRSMRLATGELPLPDAMLSVWLDSAHYRNKVESVLLPLTRRVAGYTVCESEPLVNTRHPAPYGTRTHGLNHVVFLQVPSHLSREEWLTLWQDQHTTVAIETQQTFGYRQNLVVRRLTADAPAIDAIVEENFPPAAITDQNAFYRQDAQGELAINQKLMYQSCKRFIDFSKMARLPTSEYNFQ